MKHLANGIAGAASFLLGAVSVNFNDINDALKVVLTLVLIGGGIMSLLVSIRNYRKSK